MYVMLAAMSNGNVRDEEVRDLLYTTTDILFHYTVFYLTLNTGKCF